MLGKILTFFVRSAEMLFAGVVLALSIVAVKWQQFATVPSLNAFAAFAGGWGCGCALFGFIALLSDKLERIMIPLDALAAVMFSAAGITYAVQLRRVSCSDGENAWTNNNELINGGCYYLDGESYCGFDQYSDLPSRCHLVTANTVFLFLAFLMALTAALLGLHAWRKWKRDHPVSG